MIKKIVLLLAFFSNALAVSSMEELTWANGETLLGFLQKNSIPSSLYYNLDREDQELAAEIASKTKYQILKNENNEVEQVLIPISEELQIHIYKDLDDNFILSFTPIAYTKEERILILNVKNSAYQDIYEQSGSVTLARAMLRAFRGSVDFKNMKENDEIALLYQRKERLGKLFGDINIKMASVQVNKKSHAVFFYKDSYYDEKGKEVESFLLANPLNNARISSRFSTARYHPVLKRYRAHLGVDYAAPTGTPVKSAGNGRVSFVGTQGGYGKVVKIEHSSGYTTLYAHLSRFAAIKKGQRISQGQVIGYVGSTGLSTGPHLHFGLYYNNKAINPLSVVKITKSELKNKEKQDFAKIMQEYKSQISSHIEQNLGNPPKEESFENYIELSEISS